MPEDFPTGGVPAAGAGTALSHAALRHAARAAGLPQEPRQAAGAPTSGRSPKKWQEPQAVPASRHTPPAPVFLESAFKETPSSAGDTCGTDTRLPNGSAHTRTSPQGDRPLSKWHLWKCSRFVFNILWKLRRAVSASRAQREVMRTA